MTHAVRQSYLVLLISPDNHTPPEAIYEATTRREANAAVKQWDTDPMGLVAVVWPPWADLPLDTVLTPADS